ncbi:vesicle-trafficking protein SEC22c isoform X2 [Lepisosteus oculatus]|uniref:vesicle-trafficking protein SEC22c isoform X2 n=1 Tax=Lepisosteus oculatus TaxID=7918 RepID=UPI003719107C
MSLILFAFVVRVRDGLPLSASTDFEHNRELHERKQQLKTISKALTLFPERGTVKGHELNIYFITSEGVSYMTICSSGFPTTMAFCFLEDLRWEFTAAFDSTTVALASRPYSFLEFDGVIQKMKHQYSNCNSLSLSMSLMDIQEDLRARPPEILNLEEMVLSNGTANGHTEPVSGAGSNQRLEPVTTLGILSLVLNIMCAALNLIRGVHLIEYTFQDDNEGIWNVIAFLVAFACCLCQVGFVALQLAGILLMMRAVMCSQYSLVS